MPQPLAISEATPMPVAAGEPNKGRYLFQLISPGKGSSGVYSPEVIQEAAKNRIFPAGLQSFMDHPTVTEAYDRPERSVRDLVAVLLEDARWDGNALVAEAQVFAPYRELVEEMRGDIGLSIRAAGVAEQGEYEGQPAQIITAITEGISVDFVTRAGRGGRVLALLESARTAPLREGHGMTANDLRDAVSSAVRDVHAGDKRYAWVRDYTDEWVVFELETPDSSQLLQQTYSVTDGTVSMTGTPVEVTARTTYVPVNSAGQSISTTESEEPQAAAALADETDVTAGTPPAALNETEGGALMGTQNTGPAPGTAGTTVVLGEAERLSQLLAESRTALAEANARADKADKRAAAAEQRSTLVEAQRGAEVKARAMLAESDLKEAAWGDVITRVCDSLELTEAGKVDDAKLTTAIEAEIHAERTKVARLMEAYGVGAVSGLGGSSGEKEFSESEFEAGMTDVFTSLGLSAEDAKTAAKGR